MPSLVDELGQLTSFHSHVEQISKNPRIDVEKVRKAKYLHEFDR